MSRNNRHGNDREWETDPCKKLSEIFGGGGRKTTAELSRPKPDTENSQKPTPLVSSDVQGWDIDDLAKRFSNNFISVTNDYGTKIIPCSVDALYFQKNNWVFVEFKDDKVILRENGKHAGEPECDDGDPVIFNDTPRNYKAWLQRKLYDTQYMFDKYGKCWDANTTIAYIVVKHGCKNPAEKLNGTAPSRRSDHDRLRGFSRHLESVIYPHYVVFAGMKFMYRYVQLVDETVFKREILRDLSPSVMPSE